jgi:transposase
MKYVGVDLHKKTLSLCVIEGSGAERRIVDRRRFACCDEAKLREYFATLVPFQVVVEATIGYEWFAGLAESLADRVVLAHPRKLRIIAESSRKTDRIDAQVLAEFLALDMIPEAHRPSPRQREHRVLTRRRQKVVSRIASAKNQLRSLLTRYNADSKALFTPAGQEALKGLVLSIADRFVAERLREDLAYQQRQLDRIDQQLRRFSKRAPVAEREARAILETIPCVGPVTIDVVLSELGDIRRFRSQKQVVAYAGLAPGVRASAGKSHAVGITHDGSPRLRWAQIATRWARHSCVPRPATSRRRTSRHGLSMRVWRSNLQIAP